MNAHRLAPLLLVAACAKPPELQLTVRLPADRHLLTAVARVNMTATRDGVVLASSSNSSSATTVSLHGLSHGARTVISLDGVDDSGTLIARGKTCPVDFESSGMTAPLYFAPTNFFAPTAAAPSLTRNAPAALALDNGTVLVIGGSDDAGAPLGTTDLFTPGSATFAASSPSLAQPRARAQAVALSSVGLLVVGGVDSAGATIADAELYSETQSGFLPISDPRLDGRVGHRVNALPNGTVFVSGGRNSDRGAPLATTLVLDVRSDGTSRVSAGPPLAAARSEHAATVSIGVAIVFGGYDATGAPMDSIEAVDLTTGSSSVVGRLQFARAEATASLLNDGSILIVGGVGAAGTLKSAELYNPITRSTTLHDMAGPRHGHSATVLTDGNVLVAGGFTDAGTTRPTTSVEMFAATGFVTERSLGTARGGHAAVSLCDETVLVVGGGAGAELYSQPAN